MRTTRRSVLAAAAAAPLAACARPSGGPDVIVVGAGVFGAWTAEHLRRAGKRVLLVDQMGPANARASSGGESRMTRSAYGRDAIYTRMALASLEEWRRLSQRATLPLFHNAGVLFFFAEMVDYARDSIAVHRELNLPLEQLDHDAMAQRWPQIDFTGVTLGLFEPEFGALMARRGVEETVARFVAQGGEYRLAHATPGPDGHHVLLDGEAARAEAIVYACGPWLPKVFPELLGQRIFVTRQEVAFIAPPDGDERFEPAALPGWADFNGGDLYYGFPNLEGRGFKIARDTHGPDFDPDTGDRRMSEDGAALLRAFADRRFPALAGRPFTEFRVCQYENSSNGDFLIDRHPDLEGAFLLGGGSGHGFKHGPEVGRMMADLVLGRATEPDERFSLATKATVHARTVL
ncbi:MAG: FAD-dependent oxidoreductase [Hyphomonadaceae bacterium]|nr:FAD-dependent oxidoreductase [Hyphomonadaceae bacterium]MBX3510811.1 FAD-dependent oxidoreductase [Hyphomonadaceae bacterium]